MKHVQAALCLIAAAAVAACSAERGKPGNGPSANRMSTADAAAGKALELLPQLVNESNYRGLGFASLAQAKAARLGAPLARRTVSYRELLTWDATKTLSDLFTADEQLVYPLEAGGAARSGVTVTKRADGWSIGAVGEAQLGQLIDLAGSDRASLSIVSVPGLNLEFAGVLKDGAWTLVPADEYPDLGLAKGRPVAAAEALPALARYATEFEKNFGEQLRARRLLR